MSEAPETIWLSVQPDYWKNNIGTVFTLKNGSHDIAYRRADLPLTTDQLLSDPRVKALVGALGDISNGEPEWPDEPQKELDWCRNRATAVLNQLKEQTSLSAKTIYIKKGENA
jgi:hypothetical protein